MAVLIKLLRASTLDELEEVVNDFFDIEAEDVRVEASLAGGITFANGEYVAPVRLSAPHKRKFETVEQAEAVQTAAAEAELEARAEADSSAADGGNANAGE